MSYLKNDIQRDMVKHSSGLGWTLAPDGTWAPVALGVDVIPPQRPLGQTEPVAPVQAAAGSSPFGWILFGVLLYAFRKPVFEFLEIGEEAATKAVKKLRRGDTSPRGAREARRNSRRK